MKRDLFRRYVWLIDVIRHAKKITFEEISGLWEKSPLNGDHSPLALRTFHNHRDAIEHLFGIKIVCDRSDHNRYYVSDDDRAESTRLKVWMLQTLSLSNLITKSENVENRIVMDVTPEEKFGLSTIIEAMKRNTKVRLVYSIPTSEEHRTEFLVDPYCVRFWSRAWFMLAKEEKTGKMLVFDLARVMSLEMTDQPFVYEEGFFPMEFFKNYYGMDVDPALSPVKIRLKVGGRTRDMIRTQPLHQSQKEIMAGLESSIFEYYFVPSDDFKRAVLSMGDDVEVIGPQELRDEILERIRHMAEKYSPETELSDIRMAVN